MSTTKDARFTLIMKLVVEAPDTLTAQEVGGIMVDALRDRRYHKFPFAMVDEIEVTLVPDKTALIEAAEGDE